MRILGGITIVFLALCALAVWDGRDLSPERLEAIYVNEHSAFIDVNGARIHYRDEGDGPIVLLIHGYSTSLQNWDGWTSELTKNYRVIRLDLPGHGLTGPYQAGDYSPEGQTKTVSAFIEELGLENIVIGGNSLGGLIAWRYALEHPGNTRALVLVSPGGFLFPDAVENEPGRVPAAFDLLRFVFPEFLARTILETNYADDNKITDDAVRRYRDLIRRKGNRKALLTAMRQFVLYDPTEALGRIEQPTLILWGRDDEVLPVSDAQLFHDAMPNSQLMVFEELGHILMEEAPAETLAPVQAFLADAASSGLSGGGE